MRSLVLAAALFLVAISAVAASKAETVLKVNTVRVQGGTGVQVQGASGKPYILTNFHVCLANKYRLVTYPDRRQAQETVVSLDYVADLCLLTASKAQAYATVADSISAYGFTRGYPDGVVEEHGGTIYGEFDWDHEFYSSSFPGKHCPDSYKPVIVVVSPSESYVYSCKATFHNVATRIYSRPGSSGSPVVNRAGRLVGLIQSFDEDNAYAAGLVPLSSIQALLNRF